MGNEENMNLSEEAFEKVEGFEEGDNEYEQADNPTDEVVEEADGDEAQEVPAESGEAEEEDPAPAEVGIDGAVQKLQKELSKITDKYEKEFAEALIPLLIERCKESESFVQDVCQAHKSYKECFKYVYEQARKARNGITGPVRHDHVAEWAEDYYRRDDKAEAEKRAKQAEEAAAKKAKSPEQEKLEKRNKAAQMKAKQKAESEAAPKKDKPKPEPKEKPQKKSNEMDGQMDLFSMLGM